MPFIKYQDYSTDNSDVWFNSGSRLIDLFCDEQYLICYIGEYSTNLKEDIFKLVFIDKEKKR
ncbi:MAG: hypothetical protein ACEPO8_05270 [Rhodothermaceae bacterium]